MRLLAAADLHGAQYRLNILYEKIKTTNPDVVIIAGDITHFGPAETSQMLLDQLRNTTVLAVTGNCDPPETTKYIDKSSATNIENTSYTYKGMHFIGLPSTPGMLRTKLPNHTSIIDEITTDTILVSHVPAHGYQDRVYIGMHAGSRDIRKILDEKQPLLHICGHVHENPGITKTDHTTIINASMGKRGAGALIEISKDKTVQASMLKD